GNAVDHPVGGAGGVQRVGGQPPQYPAVDGGADRRGIPGGLVSGTEIEGASQLAFLRQPVLLQGQHAGTEGVTDEDVAGCTTGRGLVVLDGQTRPRNPHIDGASESVHGTGDHLTCPGQNVDQPGAVGDLRDG